MSSEMPTIWSCWKTCMKVIAKINKTSYLWTVAFMYIFQSSLSVDVPILPTFTMIIFVKIFNLIIIVWWTCQLLFVGLNVGGITRWPSIKVDILVYTSYMYNIRPVIGLPYSPSLVLSAVNHLTADKHYYFAGYSNDLTRVSILRIGRRVIVASSPSFGL